MEKGRIYRIRVSKVSIERNRVKGKHFDEMVITDGKMNSIEEVILALKMSGRLYNRRELSIRHSGSTDKNDIKMYECGEALIRVDKIDARKLSKERRQRFRRELKHVSRETVSKEVDSINVTISRYDKVGT